LFVNKHIETKEQIRLQNQKIYFLALPHSISSQTIKVIQEQLAVAVVFSFNCVLHPKQKVCHFL
jgi:hypothetical protein